MTELENTVIIRGRQVPKKHYSFSRVQKFVICPLKEYWHYREGLREPKNSNLILGSNLHAVLEFDYSVKIATGKNEPLDVKQDFLIGVLKQELAAPDVVLEPGEDLNSLSKVALKMLASHHVERALTANPVAMEQMHIVYIPGVSVPVVLFIDMIEETEQGKKRVVDLKTSRNRYQPHAAATSMQLALGSFATGIEDVQYDVLVKGSGAFQAVPGKMVPSVRDYNLMRMSRALSCIEAEVYIPPEPGEWPCNPSCFYWGRCAGKHIPEEVFAETERQKVIKAAERAAKKAEPPKKTVRKKATVATEPASAAPVE